jgi:hypothetical protein
MQALSAGQIIILILTEEELYRVFFWLRDRTGWPEYYDDRTERVESEFRDLIETFTNNLLFKTIHSGDGSNGNYLEFICFPRGGRIYQAEAIIVSASICAPVSAYGQIFLDMTSSSEYGTQYGTGTLKPEAVGIITDQGLVYIEKEIKAILKRFNFEIIDNEFASKLLPTEVENYLRNGDAYRGNQYFHGIFQLLEW